MKTINDKLNSNKNVYFKNLKEGKELTFKYSIDNFNLSIKGTCSAVRKNTFEVTTILTNDVACTRTFFFDEEKIQNLYIINKPVKGRFNKSLKKRYNIFYKFVNKL